MEQLSDECRRAVKQFTSSYRRARHAEQVKQLNRAVWGCVLLWGGHGVYLIFQGEPGLSLIQFIGAVGSIFALWTLRGRNNVILSAWILVGVLLLGLAGTSLFTGGLEATSAWFLSFPVLFAVPFVTARDIRWMCWLPVPVMACVYFIGLALPSIEQAAIPEGYTVYAQLQMTVLYTVFCQYSTKLGEREVESLAQQREKSNQEATRAAQENEKKSRFLAKMSHELRTPMNGLLGMVQYLETRSLSPESLSYLSRLRKRSEHILEHINDALDLTQVDAGSASKGAEPFDLSRMISRICDVQTQFGSKEGCALDVQIDLPSSGFVADHRRLRHLLSTIVGTAFQESADGVVSFRVWRDQKAANDAAAPGLPVSFEVLYVGRARAVENALRAKAPAERERGSVVTSTLAFEGTAGQSPLERGDLSAKFASAFRVSELLGGSFFVAREEGQQVRACARIPLLQADVPKASATSLPNMSMQDLAPSQRYVLVVDDNAINRKVACLLLQKLGCKCDTANDGIEAVQMASEHRYDAVFMDLRMPNMDGFEATRQIIAGWKSQDQGFPIMALTANAYEEDVSRALEAGMVTHISKPVNAAKLREVLETYVSGSSDPAQLQRSVGGC